MSWCLIRQCLIRQCLVVSVSFVSVSFVSVSFVSVSCAGVLQISTRAADYLIDTLACRSSMHLLNLPFTNPAVTKVSVVQ